MRLLHTTVYFANRLIKVALNKIREFPYCCMISGLAMPGLIQ